MPESPLLTTGQAARLLGCSRQHVANLCARGELPVLWAGSHRRLRRGDVERLLHPSIAAPHKTDLTRDQERSLWLHRALLATLAVEPDATVALARGNILRRLEAQTRPTMESYWAREWLDVLDQGVDALAEVLSSPDHRSVELRQNSPFAGALPQDLRTKVLTAFKQHWRDEHRGHADGTAPVSA